MTDTVYPTRIDLWDFFRMLVIVVHLCIYKALYGDAAAIDGVTYEMVATNFVIALGLSQAFSFNEMFLPDMVVKAKR